MDRIDQMLLFALVARHGSFSKAALEINKPVQTVSKAVRQLEEHLGVVLFDRTTRSVALNYTGRAYLDRAQDLLDQFDDLEASVRDEHGSPTGKIRMTAPTSFGEKRLAPVLGEFLASYPDIELDLTLTNSRVSLVEDGIDLALRIGPLRDSSLIVRRLADMRVVTVASKPFLDKWGRPEVPEDLVTLPCILDTNYDTPEFWPYLTAFGDSKIKRIQVQSSVRTNSPEANRQLAVSGVGVAMCPMYVVNEDIVNGNLIPLFEDLEANDFGVHALYPHRRHLTTRVRVLIDYLESHFRLM